jgi:CheY-like chemotaxis protein/HPt (histidine-containing phosphotransfer) domain-containing protein
LQQAGLKIDIAENGALAIKALEQEDYDAVLMDVQMPVMDGYQATRKIRENPRWSILPIIAMTANAMSGDREKSLEAGMNDHVTKPINPVEVMTALNKWVSVKEVALDHGVKVDINPPDEQAWPEISGVNWTDGLARVGGNRNLYKKLLSQFRSGNAKTVDQMKSALGNGDANTAARMAHSVRGVAANLGADPLASVGAELEMFLKQGNLEGSEGLIARFEAELSFVMDGIRVFEVALAERKREEEQTADTALDLELVREYITQLARMLERGMVDSMEQIEVLDRQLAQSELQLQWERLKREVDVFNMDGALEQLHEIVKVLGL